MIVPNLLSLQIRRSHLSHYWAGTSIFVFQRLTGFTHTHTHTHTTQQDDLSTSLEFRPALFPFLPSKSFVSLDKCNQLTIINNQLSMSWDFYLCYLCVRQSPSLLPECEEDPSPLCQLQGSQASYLTNRISYFPHLSHKDICLVPQFQEASSPLCKCPRSFFLLPPSPSLPPSFFLLSLYVRQSRLLYLKVKRSCFTNLSVNRL